MSIFINGSPGRRLSPKIADVLRHLESNSVQYFGHVVAIEPLHEMLGPYSRVVRVRLLHEHGSTHAYVKVYEPRCDSAEAHNRFRRHVVTEFERTRLARTFVTASTGVPRPLVCLPEELIIVTEETRGVPLQRRLRQTALLRTPANIGVLETGLRRVGEWVRGFQEQVPIFGRNFPYRKYLDIRLKGLVALGRPSFLEHQRQAMLAAFDAAMARLSSDDLRLVPVHADLCPSNILVGKDAISILDFGSSSDGPRCYDVAHLVMHLRLAGPRLGFSRRITNRLVQALMSGFDPALAEHDACFRFVMIIHVACHLITAGTSGRYDLTTFGEWRFRRAVSRGTAIAGVQLELAS